MTQSIGTVFREQTLAFPAGQAVAFPEQGAYLTYAQWWSEAERIARGLVELGICPGDRVALQAQNRVEWAVVQMATLLCGAIFVPLNTHLGAEETQYVLEHSGSRAVFLSNRFRSHGYLQNLQGVRNRLPDLQHVIVLDESAYGCLDYAGLDGPVTSFPEPGVEDDAALLYTSGTTGFPKGALLSHGAMLHVARQTAQRLLLTGSDRWTSIIPLFHCAGCIMNLMGCMVAGACYVGVSAFDPVLMFRVIQDEKCTALSGVPTSFLAMRDHPERSKYDLGTLRTGTCGGAQVDPDLLAKCVAEFPIPELVQVYGLTETATLAALPWCDDPERIATAGRALDDAEIRIVDIDSGVELPAGTVGEIVVRGPMVMQGYYNNPGETSESLSAAGWFKTGDLGYLTADGRLCVSAGRLKEMIIRGGENIYPLEVEKVFMEQSRILQVAVFGVSDAYYGEVPAVALVVDNTVEFSELESIADRHLAAYKVPRTWYLVKELPMTPSGKIKKLALKQMAESGELAPAYCSHRNAKTRRENHSDAD